MTAKTKGKLNLIKRALRPIWVGLLWLTKPAANITAPQEQRRWRILAVYFLFLAIVILAGLVTLLATSDNTWPVLAFTEALLLIGYILLRFGYYRTAVILAIATPAVSVFAQILLHIQTINIEASLMWLAMPLLISPLLLSPRPATVTAAGYIIATFLLNAVPGIPIVSLGQGLAFIGMITFFTIAVAAIRRRDQTEIETQLRELKKKDAALADEAVRRRILVEQSSDGIVVLDQNGKVYETNQRFADMLGYSMEEVRQLFVWDWEFLFPREKVVEMIRTVDENGDHFETQHRRKDGTIYDVEISTNGAVFAGQKLIFCVCRDITERKRAEAELRNNEERFRLLADNSTDLISRIQLVPEVKTDYVSPSCRRITGYRQEDFYADSGLGLRMIHPEDREYFQKSVAPDNKEPHKPISIRLVRKDGGIIHVEQTHTMIFNEQGQPVALHVIARDITERVKAEEALRESEEKFSKAFHGSPESISITTLKDGRFIEVNDGFIRDKGYSRKEIIGHTSAELAVFVNPDERDNITKTLTEKGRFKNLQVEYRTKSGAIRTGLLSAEIITLNDEPCIILMNNDITERRRVEDALRESEEKFSRAFHGSPDSMTISTLGDGTFVEVNESYTRLIGYSREELLGHNATEFNMWADDEQQERIVRNIRQQTKMHNEELLLRTKSGEILTLLYSTEYVHIGGELCLLSVCTDITERKRAEEELRKTGARLEATNKELEAFSYSVSHDLRSPLRSIDGFSQALLEDYAEKLDETGQDYLKRLRNASQKMGELIDGILKLSRLTRGEMQYEEVNLSELVQEITTRLQEGQPERKVKFVIAKDLTARGDVQMLRALLENLLGNAWKFTGKSPRARIEFGLSRNGDKPAFFIKDNGAGFDAAYADKLFNAFQRLHSEAEFPGTGIGLATVRRIINRHGGTIRAEGEAGKGATFYFTLE